MKRVIRVYDWDGDFLGYAKLFYIDEDLTYELTMNKDEATVLDITCDAENDARYTIIDNNQVGMGYLSSVIFDSFTAILETV